MNFESQPVPSSKEQMIAHEKSRLLERFKDASGRVKVLLSAFLLSTVVGCAQNPTNVEPGSEGDLHAHVNHEDESRYNNDPVIPYAHLSEKERALMLAKEAGREERKRL